MGGCGGGDADLTNKPPRDHSTQSSRHYGLLQNGPSCEVDRGHTGPCGSHPSPWFVLRTGKVERIIVAICDVAETLLR